MITLGFRPQGEYAGRPGREQFFIQKEGGVAHRQVLALPRPRRRIPVIPLGIALAAVGVVAIILLFVIPNIGSDNEEPRSVAVMPTDTPEPATATTWARETQVPPPTEHVLPGSPDTQPTATPNVAMPTATSPVNSELRPLESDAGLVNMPANHRGGLEINRNQSVAQSFTVPSDGVVTGAEIVGLSGGGCVDGEGFHFRLLATDQGFPGALIFYEEALSASSVSEQPGIIQITFGLDGWQVGAFESMALELSIDASSTGCAYAWDGDSPGGYRGGQTVYLYPGHSGLAPRRPRHGVPGCFLRRPKLREPTESYPCPQSGANSSSCRGAYWIPWSPGSRWRRGSCRTARAYSFR